MKFALTARVMSLGGQKPVTEGKHHERRSSRRAPVHLWIVGILAALWNGFGCYDYLMTRMRNLEYFRSMAPDVDPNVMLAWVDGFPFYAQFGWGLGRMDGPARFDPAAHAPSLGGTGAGPVIPRSGARAWLPDFLRGPAAPADRQGMAWRMMPWVIIAIAGARSISMRTASKSRACCARRCR